jgi:RNA polymerase sigma-70 factor (ECF subfamily)
MQNPTLAAVRRAEDAALATQVLERPDEAILTAWRRFRPLVRQILRKMLGADEEVRDLSQEAFLQFHRSVRGLRSPEAIRPFVAGIAVRLALEEIRRRRVRGGQVLLPGQGLVPPANTSTDPEAREAMVRLIRMVERLSAADRDMFVLRQIEGREQTEISAATRLSISTVRRRLWRLQRRVSILVHNDPALSAYAERARTRTLQRMRIGGKAASHAPPPVLGDEELAAADKDDGEDEAPLSEA